MNTFTKAAALLGLCGLTALAHAANTATDYSSTNNPNGAWQYGYEATLKGAFTLYDEENNRGTALSFWIASNLGATPSNYYNPTSSPISVTGAVLQPHQAAFHPGPNGEYSLYRWISPVAGVYVIDAGFVGIGNRSTTDVHILIDGDSIFAGSINGFDSTTNFNGTRQLTAGSIVDFAVGPGSDNYVGDSTGINASITAVPEPETWALMAAGLWGVGYASRRARPPAGQAQVA